MSDQRKTRISLRRAPKQTRSTDLVAAILEAALQVLAKEGARRFTTTRVAERAGVSVGSVYQYFPNKAAILFRLQNDEWRQTRDLLSEILGDTGLAPLKRLTALVFAFIRSECAEAEVRTALADAAPLYRDAPETKAARAAGQQALHAFIREVLPTASDDQRQLVAELTGTTLSAAGKQFSALPRTPAEIDRYAQGLADMLCAYLASLGVEAARD